MAEVASAQGAWLAALPGIFTWAQAREHGLSNYALYELRDAGLLEQLGRGLFAKPGSSLGDADLAAAAFRAPAATICLRSALARHGLIDEIPARLDLAHPDGARAPKLGSLITWHHFAPQTFDRGRDLLDIGSGQSIGLYNAERSIVDAFRLRRLEGHELGVEALKTWLRRRDSHPTALLSMASEFPRAEAPLRRTLEVLL